MIFMATDGKRYNRIFTVPRTVPDGGVLAHNHVRHTLPIAAEPKKS
jgi:hypothetical protein